MKVAGASGILTTIVDTKYTCTHFSHTALEVIVVTLESKGPSSNSQLGEVWGSSGESTHFSPMSGFLIAFHST